MEETTNKTSNAADHYLSWHRKIELLPQELYVTIIKHTLSPNVCAGASDKRKSFECWTWITDGMWRCHQKELVITVKCLSNEQQPPEGPIQFFQLVYQFAVEGNIVDEGETTEFGSGFMDNVYIGGIVYVPAQELTGVPLIQGRQYLSAILVLREELEVVKLCGASRLMALLARHYGCFPYPCWSERDKTMSRVVDSKQLLVSHYQQEEKKKNEKAKEKEKKENDSKEKPDVEEEGKEEETTEQLVIAPHMTRDTMLPRLRRLRFMKAKAHVYRNNIKLRLPHSVVPLLKNILSTIPQDKPVAILTGIDEEANAHLVWDPTATDRCQFNKERTEKEDEGQEQQKQEQHELITAVFAENSLGERYGGSFVCFSPGHEKDEGAIVEDGFVIYLTDPSWAEVKRCLLTGQSFAMIADTETGKNFEVKWTQENGMTSLGGSPFLVEQTSEGEEGSESGDTLDSPPSNLVAVREVLLLTSEKDLARRVVMKELADYISLLIGVIEKVMQSAQPEPFEEVEEEKERKTTKQGKKEKQPEKAQQQTHQEFVVQVDMYEGGKAVVEFKASTQRQPPQTVKKRVALFPSAMVIEELRERLQRVTPAPLKKVAKSPMTQQGPEIEGEKAGAVQFQINFAVARKR